MGDVVFPVPGLKVVVEAGGAVLAKRLDQTILRAETRPGESEAAASAVAALFGGYGTSLIGVDLADILNAIGWREHGAAVGMAVVIPGLVDPEQREEVRAALRMLAAEGFTRALLSVQLISPQDQDRATLEAWDTALEQCGVPTSSDSPLANASAFDEHLVQFTFAPEPSAHVLVGLRVGQGS